MNLCIKCNIAKKTRESHVCKICQNEQFERLRSKYGAYKRDSVYERVVELLEEGLYQYEIADALRIDRATISRLSERWKSENVKKTKQKRSV